MAQLILLDKDKAPASENIFAWIFYFISPYEAPLRKFFIYRFFRYTYFALLPAFIAFYVDLLQSGDFKENVTYYTTLGLTYLLFYGLTLSNTWVFKRELVLTENASRSLALLGMSILHSMPISWHVNHATGKKLELVMDARKGLFEILRIVRWQVMPIFGNLLGIFISLIYFNGPFYFAILFLLFTTLYVGVSWYFNRPMSKLYDDYKNTHSKLISKLYEFSSSILTVKSFALESFIENRAYELEQSSQDSKNIIYTTVFTRWFAVNSLAAIFLIIFCILSVQANFNTQISAGAAGGIIMLYYTLWVTLEGISVQQDQIYDFITAIRRFIKLCIEGKNSLSYNDEATEITTWNEIEFSNVHFAYESQSANALSNISIKIKKGDVVALVGPSGSGKSTIIKLLLGLAQPKQGSISIDSQTLPKIALGSWLKKIAFVPQDIELFEGTIRDNILLDVTSIENNFLDEIYKKTCLYDFIESLPNGDLTLIGERGLKLSGGQKQRIGLARALIRNPDFLILDESTSALDSLTENHIQDSLFENLKDRTLLIIAHRLSTVRNADKIIVLNEGRIDDVGTFNDLLNRDGLFSQMWGIQGLVNNKNALN